MCSSVLKDKVKDGPAVEDEYCWCGRDSVLKGKREGLCFALIIICGVISNASREGMVNKMMGDCGKGVPRGVSDRSTSA